LRPGTRINLAMPGATAWLFGHYQSLVLRNMRNSGMYDNVKTSVDKKVLKNNYI